MSFHVFRSFHDEHSSSFRGTSVTKLGSFEGLEMRRYEMSEGSVLSIDAPTETGSVKTYLIYSGSCQIVDTGETLHAGDTVAVGLRGEYLNLRFTADSVLIFLGFGVFDFMETANELASLRESMHRIQEKDAYTEAHCKRVFNLASHLAPRLGIGGDRFAVLARAARYHDIGKVHIEDEILNKASPLTESERERMKEHVVLGGELVKCSFGPLVYDIILEHHERLDGSGYPLGLKGEGISEDGRILAICDAFDAMTTDRPYRPGLSVEQALAALETESGTLYDAEIVRIFSKMVRDQPQLLQ